MQLMGYKSLKVINPSMMMRMGKKLERAHVGPCNLQMQAHNRVRKAKLGQKKAHSIISKHIKNEQVVPLGYIRRQRDMGANKPKGSIVTDPKHIDEVLRDAWGEIFKGNHKALLKASCDFMQDYEHLCFKDVEFRVEGIKLQDL